MDLYLLNADACFRSKWYCGCENSAIADKIKPPSLLSQS